MQFSFSIGVVLSGFSSIQDVKATVSKNTVKPWIKVIESGESRHGSKGATEGILTGIGRIGFILKEGEGMEESFPAILSHQVFKARWVFHSETKVYRFFFCHDRAGTHREKGLPSLNIKQVKG